jgi:hypothetical protein
MHEKCGICGYNYYREPGYFLGAMYVSYGLAVGEGLATFLLAHFCFPELSTLNTVFAVIAVILMCAIQNFKYARVIYLYIFPN